jgi:hypothetical protein
MDGNKTALTHRVTAVAAAYLDALGCKPVETEVAIRPGWVADLASYWYPTNTEAKKLHLGRRAAQVLGDADDPNPRGLVHRTFGHGPYTVCVEVKISHQDFAKSHSKWIADPPAHICFLAFPHGLVSAPNVPAGWYGLETSSDGSKLLRVDRTRGTPNAQHPGPVLDFVAQVGIRRDHRTRFAASRDWLKAYRAQDTEQKRQYSASRLLDGLAAWLQGRGWKSERPFRELLPELGIKKVPGYCDDAIDYLESLRRTED